MRKTSHDGVDTTSITSGTENEVKKSSTTGIMKIKKSSIKRKVPSFSHESDDGIVEPLLQSDKDKSETAPRSAKYLLSKTKTDSISENEDSIKVSERNISNFSALTPSTSTNKVMTTVNMNNIKDSNNVTNITEVTTSHNHMITNNFCESETSKAILTKSPILVELDAAKTTGYNPSLIFTTAKIHSDCKTKLLEPVQVTPVPIISTTEKSISASSSVTETKHEIEDVGNKARDAANNVFNILRKSNDDLNKEDKSNFDTEIRNNSTSKAILNPTEKSAGDKFEQNMPKSSSYKNKEEINILIKTDTKNANFTTDLSNAKQISKDLNAKNTEQTNHMTQPIKPKEVTKDKSGTKDINLPSNSVKLGKREISNDKSDKKITVQGSKKLQRQKKATVEESQDTTLSTAKLPTTQTSCSKSNNSVKNETPQPVSSSKIPSQVGSVPKAIDGKIQRPVSNYVTSQPTVSKISNEVVLIPEATDSKIQTATDKNLTSQSIACSKIPTQEKTIPKFSDTKTQTPVSKIPTPTTPVNNIIAKPLTQTPSSKTIHETGALKTASTTKKGENLNSINKNESPLVTKSGAKEITPVATEKSPPVPKTLPPYIVSTSKTKIGGPVVHSATLKSETNKLASDSKSSTNSIYFVKTTPATSLKTTTTSVSTPVTTSATSKSDVNKLASDSQSSTNSTYLVKTTPATSFKNTTTSMSTPISTSATLKSEVKKLESDIKSLKTSYLSKTTPDTSLKTTATSVPIPVATSATLKSEANKLASDSQSSTKLAKTTPATSLKTTSMSTPVSTSGTLKSDVKKLESDIKSSKHSYLVKTTPDTSLKTTTTSVPTPVATSATLISEANKLASDSKSSTNSTYLVKTTPATSLKTITTSVPIPTPSSNQGMKQSVPVKQTKSNTEKQKGGSKA